uniref:PocR ligand-binding domain-containing protein n=1 Tax=Desulfobacter sp. TaxID=2294 RepID=UPI001B7807B8
MVRGVELFFSLFNNLAIFIALVTVYGYLLRNFKESARFRRQISMGISFGLFAIGCMFAKIPVFEGVIVDQRNAIIALSGVFGGPVSAVVSAFLAGAFRIHLGGGGALAGVIGVSLAAVSGIVLNRFPGSFSSVRKAFTSSLFATLIILPGFLFVKDFHTGWTLMKAMALPYGLAIFAGIMLVGLLLNREKNELAFEVALQENQERLQKEIVRRKTVEEELRRSRERLGMALSGANEGIWDWYIQKDTVFFDDRYYTMAGYEPNEFPETFGEFAKRIHAEDIERTKSAIDRYLAGELKAYKVEFRFLRKDGTYMWIQAKGKIVSRDVEGAPLRFVGLHADITERKRMAEALENRILALTQPLGDVSDIAFEDLFNLTDIQQLQDLYAKAFGVAAIITHPDGTPITQPSNFTDLCEKIIRNTKKGCEKCKYSDSMIGRHNPDGPNIMACLSAGLWSAGTAISVGGRHIANWLIGQVRNDALDQNKIIAYAHEIGANENDFRAAYLQVPIM